MFPAPAPSPASSSPVGLLLKAIDKHSKGCTHQAFATLADGREVLCGTMRDSDKALFEAMFTTINAPGFVVRLVENPRYDGVYQTGLEFGWPVAHHKGPFVTRCGLSWSSAEAMRGHGPGGYTMAGLGSALTAEYTAPGAVRVIQAGDVLVVERYNRRGVDDPANMVAREAVRCVRRVNDDILLEPVSMTEFSPPAPAVAPSLVQRAPGFAPAAPAGELPAGRNPAVSSDDRARAATLFGEGLAHLDAITTRHCAARTFVELVIDPGGVPSYRPSLYTRKPPPRTSRKALATELLSAVTRLGLPNLDKGQEVAVLADAYDLFQADRGDARRAYRG